ncbi:MAG: hypothetical protein AAF901_04045 [Bacteroidota bacterium]
MGKNKKKKTTSSPDGGFIMYLSGILKEVGTPGFITIVLTSVFLIWGTLVQKREFIDRFILLKNTNQNPYPCVIVVVGLLALLLLSSIYSAKMLKLRKEENNRIGKEKSELQQILLEKKLKSSE